MLSFPAIIPDNDIIKNVAKHMRITYNGTKEILEMTGKSQTNVVVYFEVLNNFIDIYTYFITEDNHINNYVHVPLNKNIFQNDKISQDYTTVIYKKYINTLSKIDVTKISKEDLPHILYDASREYRISYCELSIVLLKTIFWYLISNKTEKIFMEVKEPINNIKHKKYKHINKEITITTPIYDLGKVPTRKVNVLIHRREGWTYSHAFTVRGHYRHYKNGKVIFVQSYIKGDGELIGKTYNIKPEKYVKEV